MLSEEKSLVSFPEFQKLDLRVAKIIAVERVPNSEKLLKLEVNLGGLKRQIIAGIGKHYESEALIGREVVVVANLEPRTLMGLESQGMLLAANDEGPVILIPDREVPPGSTIQ